MIPVIRSCVKCRSLTRVRCGRCARSVCEKCDCICRDEYRPASAPAGDGMYSAAEIIAPSTDVPTNGHGGEFGGGGASDSWSSSDSGSCDSGSSDSGGSSGGGCD